MISLVLYDHLCINYTNYIIFMALEDDDEYQLQHHGKLDFTTYALGTLHEGVPLAHLSVCQISHYRIDLWSLLPIYPPLQSGLRMKV